MQSMNTKKKLIKAFEAKDEKLHKTFTSLPVEIQPLIFWKTPRFNILNNTILVLGSIACKHMNHDICNHMPSKNDKNKQIMRLPMPLDLWFRRKRIWRMKRQSLSIKCAGLNCANSVIIKTNSNWVKYKQVLIRKHGSRQA